MFFFPFPPQPLFLPCVPSPISSLPTFCHIESSCPCPHSPPTSLVFLLWFLSSFIVYTPPSHRICTRVDAWFFWDRFSSVIYFFSCPYKFIISFFLRDKVKFHCLSIHTHFQYPFFCLWISGWFHVLALVTGYTTGMEAWPSFFISIAITKIHSQGSVSVLDCHCP